MGLLKNILFVEYTTQQSYWELFAVFLNALLYLRPSAFCSANSTTQNVLLPSTPTTHHIYPETTSPTCPSKCNLSMNYPWLLPPSEAARCHLSSCSTKIYSKLKSEFLDHLWKWALKIIENLLFIKDYSPCSANTKYTFLLRSGASYTSLASPLPPELWPLRQDFS